VLQIGVRVAQGFLFGRAVPPDEIEARYGPSARAARWRDPAAS
jgi:EAL domain-containing protein (putative c-di-GMP-specific phosphodiesterase class I)